MVYTSEHPIFAVTVDVVALTIRAQTLCALMVRRGGEPFAGHWALPGGFVEPDEDLRPAALRELQEETAIEAGAVRFEQLATFGTPERDPRGRTVSVAWLAVLPDAPDPRAGSDAAHAEWKPVDQLLAAEPLAFDHHEILSAGLERARARLEHTALAAEFVDEQFTLADLRRVYEVVWGDRLDPDSFHRKVTSTKDFVIPVDELERRGSGQPPELFRFGGAQVLHPPLARRTFD